jgi:hypothetical protein
MRTKLYAAKNIVLIFVLFLIVTSCTTELETYTITFDGNGATGTPPAPIKIQKLEYHDLPDEGNLKYEGKVFYGWNTNANGTGKLYSVGYPWSDRNATLYAQWTDLGTVTNLRYSFGNTGLFDGIHLDFDSSVKIPERDDYYGNHDIYWDGKAFIAYVLFRNSTVGTGGDPIYTSNGFKPHEMSFTPDFRELRFDIVYGGEMEYFVAICKITYRDNYGYNRDIIVGPHSNVVSLEIIGEGTPLIAPKLRAVLYGTNTYGERMVNLSWQEIPRAYGYRLYYSYDNVNFSNIEGNTVTVIHRTSYTDYISEGRTVYYKVTAVNRMMENGYFSNSVIPRPLNTSGDTYEIVLRNNYASAISRAYTRNSYINSWGNNLATSPIVTNNSLLLGVFEPDYYEVMVESVAYYRVNTGTNDNGLNVTSGILDGYQPIYYLQPEFDLVQDITITVPATSWVKIKPE